MTQLDSLVFLQLDDWVLCRIYNKKGIVEKQPNNNRKMECFETEDKKPEILANGGALFPPLPPPLATAQAMDCVYFDTSDSVPKLHTTDSSCSEHVVSPEFANSEVQSEPKWNEKNALDFPYNYVDTTFGSQFQSGNNQMSPLQDIFMYLSKPFWKLLGTSFCKWVDCINATVARDSYWKVHECARASASVGDHYLNEKMKRF